MVTVIDSTGSGSQGIVWPQSAQTFRAVPTARGGATLKLALEDEVLQLWLEDVNRFQYYARKTRAECAEILGSGFDPSLVLEMLERAVQGEEGGAFSLSFEWQEEAAVVLTLRYRPDQFCQRSFDFLLSQRSLSHMDRLERRVEDLELDTARRPEANEARRRELDGWRLHVVNPFMGPGYVASSNHFLVQDDDYERELPVAFSQGSPGHIEASFDAPVHVESVKLAPACDGAMAAGDSLAIYVQSPETGLFEAVRTGIPSASTREEQTFAIGRSILALRLSGNDLVISKIVFS